MQAHEYIEWYNAQEKEGWKSYTGSPSELQLAEKLFEIAREAQHTRAALAKISNSHARDMADLGARAQNLDEELAVNPYGEDGAHSEINRMVVQFNCCNRIYNSLKELVLKYARA